MTGFLVFESSDDFEQALSLDTSADKPAGGVLMWREKKGSAVVFPSRDHARAAIKQTEHYRLAFQSNHPEKRFCVIVPIKVTAP